LPRYEGCEVGVVPISKVNSTAFAGGGIVVGPLDPGAVGLMHHCNQLVFRWLTLDSVFFERFSNNFLEELSDDCQTIIMFVTKLSYSTGL
jgi:hypothetical protein